MRQHTRCPFQIVSEAVVQLVIPISLIVLRVVTGLPVSSVCSPSCLIHQDIISCRRFDRDDLMACYRQHESTTVLDLSYVAISEPIGETSFAGLNRIAIVYLDGTRFRSPIGLKAFAAMPRLRTVYMRRMRTSLDELVAAVVASHSVREVALAENFVVCSCDWVEFVARLAANDVAIIDWDDTAPRCTMDTVANCIGASSSGPSKTGQKDPKSIRRTKMRRSNSLLTAFQLASLSAAKTQSDDFNLMRADDTLDTSMEKRAAKDDFESWESDEKILLDVDVERSAEKRDSVAEDQLKLLQNKASAFEEAAAREKSNEFDVGQIDELGEFGQADLNADETAKSAEKWSKKEEKVEFDIDRAAYKRDDDGDDQNLEVNVIDDELSKREQTVDEAVSERKSAQKRDRNDGKRTHLRWISHPGTIVMIVAIAVLFCCCCAYCLTPLKKVVDEKMPSGGGDGGFMSKFSKNNSSRNASQNATPSDMDVAGEDATDAAKETTPLVSSIGSFVDDVSPQQNTSDKKAKKEKKDSKGKNKSKFGKTEGNENESHGGRQWRFGGGAITTAAQNELNDICLRDELAGIRRKRLARGDDQSTDDDSNESDL